MGFPVPLGEWMKGDLRDFFLDTFSADARPLATSPPPATSASNDRARGQVRPQAVGPALARALAAAVPRLRRSSGEAAGKRRSAYQRTPVSVGAVAERQETWLTRIGDISVRHRSLLCRVTRNDLRRGTPARTSGSAGFPRAPAGARDLRRDLPSRSSGSRCRISARSST